MLKIILSVVIGGLVGLGIYFYVAFTSSPEFLNDWIWRLRAFGGGDQSLTPVVIYVVIGAAIGGVLGSLINRLGAPKSDGPRY